MLIDPITRAKLENTVDMEKWERNLLLESHGNFKEQVGSQIKTLHERVDRLMNVVLDKFNDNFFVLSDFKLKQTKFHEKVKSIAQDAMNQNRDKD